MSTGNIIGNKNPQSLFQGSGVWGLNDLFNHNWGKQSSQRIEVSTLASPSDDISDATTYNFTGLDISAMTEDDLLVAVIQAGELGPISQPTVLIDGQSMSVDSSNVVTIMHNVIASKFGYTNASPANVSITFSTAQQRCRCTVLRLKGSVSANVVKYSASKVYAGSGTGQSINTAIPALGVAIVADYHGTQGTTTTYSTGNVTSIRTADLEAFSFAALGYISAEDKLRPFHTITTSHTSSSQQISLTTVIYGYQ